MRLSLAALLALAVIAPATAEAFCGFYVAGSDQQLFNDATQVVLMRKGTRTVLSMQNSYQGPPEAFALVVPVPVVLKESDVKTLEKAVFARVEQMGAPRLVEYWEQDPCAPAELVTGVMMPGAKGAAVETKSTASVDDLGVKVEAQFTVGEYQIVILSAKDSTGLDTWLRREKYNIPAGAEPLLRPYVEGGMKFFVAKVDPTKVRFEGGRAALSPLRFHYDDPQFTLPIRLGIANSAGTQDLIVNILAPQQRYALANYQNVFIPTNIDVRPDVRDQFGAFYAALFDATLAKHPGAIVTEYAWQASTCDPCPGPALSGSDFTTLGADVLLGSRERPERYGNTDFVLTRLHARYGKDLKDDLVFEQAPPVAGGREERAPGAAPLEQGAIGATVNGFQGRYAIRHRWIGPIRCNNPVRGRWGGPPPGVLAQPGFQALGTKAALDLATVPRGAVQLASLVASDVPEIDLRTGASAPEAPSGAAADAGGPPSGSGSAVATTPTTKKKTGCGCETTSGSGVLWPGVLAIAGIVRRRRRR